jgi:hypothetical protein
LITSYPPESFQYFQTGYGFLVEQQTGYLLATSLGIPVFNPDGSRVLASEVCAACGVGGSA